MELLLVLDCKNSLEYLSALCHKIELNAKNLTSVHAADEDDDSGKALRMSRFC